MLFKAYLRKRYPPHLPGEQENKSGQKALFFEIQETRGCSLVPEARLNYTLTVPGKKQIQSTVLIVFFIFITALVMILFLPYVSLLIWAAVFYIIISPLYKKIISKMDRKKRSFRFKKNLLAAFFSASTILIMAGIFLFIGFQLAGQGKFLIEEAKQFIADNPDFFSNSKIGSTITEAVKKISWGTVNIADINLYSKFINFINEYFDSFLIMIRSLLINISNFILSLLFICFSLYFFYSDNEYLSEVFMKAIPMKSSVIRKLTAKFREGTISLFKGFFLVAFYQAAAAFVIFASFGIHGTFLLSSLIFLASFIPAVGCAVIWLPIGIGLIISGGIIKGAVFMLLCLFFISSIDNFLRPFFLKDRIKVHPLLIFFSIVGGIKAFGFNGILFGPLIIILFFTTVDIAMETRERS